MYCLFATTAMRATFYSYCTYLAFLCHQTYHFPVPLLISSTSFLASYIVALTEAVYHLYSVGWTTPFLWRWAGPYISR